MKSMLNLQYSKVFSADRFYINAIWAVHPQEKDCNREDKVFGAFLFQLKFF